MIGLKSISGEEFILNSELIYKVEREFDTLITLVDSKTLRVQDTPEEIVEKVTEFKRRIFQPTMEVEK
jgi:flagellar protein FlbD